MQACSTNTTLCGNNSTNYYTDRDRHFAGVRVLVFPTAEARRAPLEVLFTALGIGRACELGEWTRGKVVRKRTARAAPTKKKKKR